MGRAHQGLGAAGSRSAENRRRGPGGEDDAEFGEESLQRESGPAVPLGRSAQVLRRCRGGQLSLSYAGGEESRRRAGLPARRSERAAAVELGGGCGVGG